jgi:hypothetical protein
MRNDDGYIDSNTPDADLQNLSKQALICYDNNHKNSFKLYSIPSFGKLFLYFICLAISTAFSIWIGQNIKTYINRDLVPVIEKRHDTINELLIKP